MYAQRGFSVLALQLSRRRQEPGPVRNGAGELSDAASALDWLQAHTGGEDLLDCRHLLRRLDLDAASDAPAGNLGLHFGRPLAKHYDFSFLAPCPGIGSLVHGDKDTVTPPEAVNTL